MDRLRKVKKQRKLETCKSVKNPIYGIQVRNATGVIIVIFFSQKSSKSYFSLLLQM